MRAGKLQRALHGQPNLAPGLDEAGAVFGFVEFAQAERIGAWPEVVERSAPTGEMDYLLCVVVRAMAHYSRFVMDTLLKHPSVQDCKISFALGRLKKTTALPV